MLPAQRWLTSSPGGRAAGAALLVLLLLFVASAAQPTKAGAAFGDGFGIADAQGDGLPAGKAFWAGTCDLAASPPPGAPIPGGAGSRPTTVMTDPGIPFFGIPPTYGPAPDVPPRDCIDGGTVNQTGADANPWAPAPAWRQAPVTQAGAHPDASVLFTFQRTATLPPSAGGLATPDGTARDVSVALPPGVIGNPQAVTLCTQAQFTAAPSTQCPPQSQVGVADVLDNSSLSLFDQIVPVYALEPRPGRTAEFGLPNIQTTFIRIEAFARTGSDFGITTAVARIPPTATLLQQSLTFWGVPWSPSHDRYRFKQGWYDGNTGGVSAGNTIAAGAIPAGLQAPYDPSWGPAKAFYSNPTDCDGSGPVTTLSTDSWQHPEEWKSFDAAAPPVTGCDQVPFDGRLAVTPKSVQAGASTGYGFDLSIPQSSDPGTLATAHLKKAVVTLPEGVRVNPSAADGLGGCTLAQANLGSEGDVSCPDSSKIGTLTVDTPLLADPLAGNIYLAQPHDNKFDSLLSLILVARGPGIVVKLPGKVDPDPVTGRLMATFDDNPQLPFSKLHLQFNDGPRAPLSNPPTCGPKTTHTELTAWSGKTVSSDSSFEITGCGSGGQPFGPSLAAGTANPLVGAFSPFSLSIARADADKDLKAIRSIRLPEGLLARVAGVPLCGEADAAAGTCPTSSRVGHVEVAAGAGPSPLWVPEAGRAPTSVSLTGPYRGAPYGLSIVVPAQAGPFDLGRVVVRSALHVDERTAQLSTGIDESRVYGPDGSLKQTLEGEMPTILEGIPLDLRQLRVIVDRDGFVVNPTSCAPKQVTAQAVAVDGQAADLTSPFTAVGCAALGFKPRIALSLKGATGRVGHPALTATVTMPQGGANIARAQVNLPHGEFLDQGNLNKTCTRPVLLAGGCPATSIYGYARAWTPLLDQPLEGPVYLVGGYGYKLPALVADLNGQIRVTLVGKVDSGPNKGIRNTFELVPDAPVEKFELTMKGGKKYGLLENSEDLCKAKKAKRRAIVRFTGQNGKVSQFKPVVANSCKKKGRKAK